MRGSSGKSVGVSDIREPLKIALLRIADDAKVRAEAASGARPIAAHVGVCKRGTFGTAADFVGGIAGGGSCSR